MVNKDIDHITAFALQMLRSRRRPFIGSAAGRSAMALEARPDAADVAGVGDVIVTEHLTKVFDGRGGQVHAVNDLNLTVRRGEIFGLLGPNGAGKTTTVGMLTTRVIPSSGRAEVGGIDVVAQPATAKQV